MKRSLECEALDLPGVPEHVARHAYRELTRIHRLLGDTAAVIGALRNDPLPVRCVVDLGCADGGVLRDVQARLRVDAVGIDLNPLPDPAVRFPILRADAVHDRLPEGDVAISVSLAHHLSEEDLVCLIRNVGRSCRRLILVDLVRHPVPLALFRVFIAPFLSRLSAADGRMSVRRAYTAAEMRRIVETALAGSGATFRHSVAPLFIRQMVDIRY